jgi:ABC-type amino acid transport substrate-binding protein
MYFRFILCLFTVIIIFFPAGITAGDSVLFLKYPRPQSDKDKRHIYRIKLLELALQKTSIEYGEFKIEYSTEKMSQSRAIVMIKNNSGIDLIALPASKQREEELLPVRIPVLKGLLGYRIFIIRSEDRNRFSRIKSFKELKEFSAGSGHDWLDSEILTHNGVNIVKSSNYEGLFMMLRTSRFDYFPRGVNEAFDEIESRRSNYKDIEVEKSLALYYPFPVYFFVRKDNVELAARIEKGLRLSIADGSFQRLFNRYNGNILKRLLLIKGKL